MDNQLKFAVRKFAPFEAAMQKMWEKYCAATGCKLVLAAVSMDLHELHKATIEDKGLQNGDWDIAHIVTDWIAEADEENALENLAPYININAPDNFPAGWPNSLLASQKFEEKIIALPFHDGPECLIYRKDLFENEEEKANFSTQYKRELTPPKTWDEFVEVAAFFQRPHNNLYGTAFAAYPDGHNTVFDFCLQLWTRNGNLLDEKGNLNIDTKEAFEALSFYRKIIKDNAVIHPKTKELDSVKLGQTFAEGEIAMMINWFGFAAVCDVDNTCKVKGLVAVTQVPRGLQGRHASLNVYWLYAIGKGSKHKEIAYNFIKFAINQENDKLLTLEGGIGCRLSTWHDEEINSTIPYYHKLEPLHQNAMTLPRDKNWAAKAAIIDKAVLKAIATEESIKQILDAAQKEITNYELQIQTLN